MDLLKKLSDQLEPLGGSMLLDRFVETRRAAASPPATAAPRPKQAAARAAATAAPARESEEVEPPSAAPSPAAEKTGRASLEDEVEAFMKRDELEGTDDAEVQEFLKDRSGFDPSEFG